jgi:hypothetical protein
MWRQGRRFLEARGRDSPKFWGGGGKGGNPIGIVQEEEEGREERSDAERSGFTARIH